MITSFANVATPSPSNDELPIPFSKCGSSIIVISGLAIDVPTLSFNRDKSFKTASAEKIPLIASKIEPATKFFRTIGYVPDFTFVAPSCERAAETIFLASDFGS